MVVSGCQLTAWTWVNAQSNAGKRQTVRDLGRFVQVLGIVAVDELEANGLTKDCRDRQEEEKANCTSCRSGCSGGHGSNGSPGWDAGVGRGNAGASLVRIRRGVASFKEIAVIVGGEKLNWMGKILVWRPVFG